jgi:hypothetical protein
MHGTPLEPLLQINRRQILGQVAGGLGFLGGMAASQLLHSSNAEAAITEAPAARLGIPHHAPKAKRIIYLYQEGAPSQVDTWDHKPGLVDWFDQELPASIRGEQRLTTMTSGQGRLPIAPSRFEFQRFENEQEGLWVNRLLSHTGAMAKDLCVIRSMSTEQINHGPGVTFMQTGHPIPGRPSIGAWLSYGLGSENENLPAFVVMISQGRGQMQALFSHLWGAGFLPGEHQGVQFRAARDPVLFLNDPTGLQRQDRRRMLDALQSMAASDQATYQDESVQSRMAQMEMAYRMQSSVPELTDFSTESAETLERYGPRVHETGSYAYNCLMARRMAERGVRFIQLYHRGWDHHGSVPKDLPMQCEDVDQPQAALLRDLKERGMLEETLVLWGGEFGRTVYCQGPLTREQYGRDHHPRCFTVWLAGGGIRGGITHGATDEFSYNVARDPVSVHDLHATMLHLLGIDHQRLVYRSQGLDFRLTGVEPSRVVHEILG